MTLNRFRFTSHYLIFSSTALFISLAISWMFASNFFEIMFTMDYSAPDLIGSQSEIRHNFLVSILTWETFVDSSMFYIINYIPVLVALPMLTFFDEWKLTSIYAKNRFESQKRYLAQSVFINSSITSFTIALVFTCYYSIGGLFVHRTLPDIGGFASALPQNFYTIHPYLFFLFMTWTAYFLATFVLCILAASLSVLFEKKYQVLLGVFLISMVLGFLGGFINNKHLDIYQMFLVYNTTKNTFECFISLLPTLLIAWVVFLLGRKKINYFL